MNHVKYFEAAQEVATQATCTRARCGAVIVNETGNIIGKGYNAPPLEDESQRMCDAEFNIQEKLKSDKTCCVHAEWNAIMEALQDYPAQIAGSTLYFMRVDEEGKFTEAGQPYCTVCSRLALQAGVYTFALWNQGPELYDTRTYNTLSYQYHQMS